MKYLAKATISLIISFVLISQPAFAAIPDEDVLDKLDRTNSYYYNPSGNADICSSTATTLPGNDIPEKVWNFFVQHGFTDAQTAGILGNAMAETGIEPTRASGSKFWGLFQWGYERKTAVQNKMREAGLEQYLSQEYWPSGAYKKIPAGDLDRILQVVLEYTLSESTGHWQEEIKKQTTPEAAAEVFLVLFERAVNGNSEILYYAPYRGILYQGAERRRNFAKEFYEKYSGNGATISGPDSTLEKGANLYVIGDSFINNSRQTLLEKFPELTNNNINATDGRRDWDEGVEYLKTIKGKKYIVFALGYDNPNLTSAQIENAINAKGQDTIIIFVTNYDYKNPNLYTSNNELFRKYAKEQKNVLVADLESKQKTEIDAAIDKTLTATMIYNAINGTINTTSGCNIINGEFEKLVVAYAWPEYHKAPFTDRMPAYADAVSTSISEKRYVGGSVNGVPGIDCGGFVTIITQNSGIEPNYNDTKGGTDNQERWVNSHNWILLNGDRNTRIDTSILQPGDIAFTTGHTFIYVGEIPGFNSVIASASYGAAWARAPMAGHEDLIYNKEPVRWYRKPNLNNQ